MSEYALRFNESKLDWTLLDFMALEPLVHAMTYGATKYTRKLDLNALSLFQLLNSEVCQKLEFVLNVENLKELSQRECATNAMEKTLFPLQNALSAVNSDLLRARICAAHATKKTEFLEYPKHVSLLGNIRKIIEKEMDISNVKESEIKEEEVIQNILRIWQEKTSFTISPNTVYQKIFTKSSVQEVVRYAEALSGFTLITTIRQADSEVYYVENAIRESDCLMKMFQFFSELFPTSWKAAQNKLELPGRNNWKLPCKDPEQHIQSAMRHLIAIIQGEEYDESGVRHTGHVLANMMMYNFHTSSMAPKLIKAIEQVAKTSEECHHVYTAHRDPYCTVCGKLLI